MQMKQGVDLLKIIVGTSFNQISIKYMLISEYYVYYYINNSIRQVWQKIVIKKDAKFYFNFICI